MTESSHSIVLEGVTTASFGDAEADAVRRTLVSTVAAIRTEPDVTSVEAFASSWSSDGRRARGRRRRRRGLLQDAKSDEKLRVRFTTLTVEGYTAELAEVVSTGDLAETLGQESSGTNLDAARVDEAETEELIAQESTTTKVIVAVFETPSPSPARGRRSPSPTAPGAAAQGGSGGGGGGGAATLTIVMVVVIVAVVAGVALCLYRSRASFLRGSLFTKKPAKNLAAHDVEASLEHEELVNFDHIIITHGDEDEDRDSGLGRASSLVAVVQDDSVLSAEDRDLLMSRTRRLTWAAAFVAPQSPQERAPGGGGPGGASSSPSRGSGGGGGRGGAVGSLRWPMLRSKSGLKEIPRFVRRLEADGSLSFVSATEGIFDLKANAALQERIAAARDATLADRAAAFRETVDALRVDWQVGRVEFKVRREAVLVDAFAKLHRLPADHWRRPFFVSFQGEDGLDAGGLSREFFAIASKQLLDVDVGLFKYANKQEDLTYQLNDDRVVENSVDDRENWLVFAGRLVGKALLEGHHCAAALNPVLLKHICCEPIALDDLQLLDYDLWRSLDMLSAMTSDQLKDLELTFALDQQIFGSMITTELCPGGAEIELTAENVLDFQTLRLRQRVFAVCEDSLRLFLRGVYSVIPPEPFLLLTAHELELALLGTPELNVDDWKSSTVYKGAYAKDKAAHCVVKWFWEELETWDHDRRARLLQWCTGTARVPVQGFNYLPGRDGALRKFTLTSIELSQAVYPRAHTCFNRIDLPLFKSRADLAQAFDLVLAPQRESMDASALAFTMD